VTADAAAVAATASQATLLAGHLPGWMASGADGLAAALSWAVRRS
jgi:hypothetical protein